MPEQVGNQISKTLWRSTGTSAGFWLGVNAALPPEAKKILKTALKI